MSRETIEPHQFMGFVRLKLRFFAFLFSILLTLAAFFLVRSLPKSGALQVIIGILGLVQAWIQLFVFLHLGREPKPRWNLIVFLFTVMVTLILVIGSLWIMHHLNYNLMAPHD